jgi:DNA mismatch repair protein MutS2
VVREVRNNGRLMVDVRGHRLVVQESDASLVDAGRHRSRVSSQTNERDSARSRPEEDAHRVVADVDLHGLTVEEALDRVQGALNDALLANIGQLRFIHGRGGGRIRVAVHRRLREIPSVRRFVLDPRNEGVTIVTL